ncbi:MAG: WD40 repeat domain-containing protein [Xenococcus sp. (in: cyanobacteria)]
MNLATQEELCLEKNNVSEEIYSLSFDRDNKWLVAGTRQGNIYTWNLRNDNIKLRQYKNVGQEPIYSMNFLDNLGKPLFIIGDNEGTISIFNLEKNKLEKFKKVHSKAIYKISVSGDGIIASASEDNTVKLYKLDDGELNKLSILGGREEEKEDAIHNGVVSDVIFSSNNKLLVTISTDKYIRIWEKTQNKQGKIIYRYLERFKEPEVGVSSIKFQSNQELLIAKNDGTLASWYINESKLERLDRLLEDGCLWLEDYLSTQPDKTKDLIGCNSLKK